MPLKVRCTSCEAAIVFKTAPSADRTIACPKCSARLTVRAPRDRQTVAPPPRAGRGNRKGTRNRRPLMLGAGLGGAALAAVAMAVALLPDALALAVAPAPAHEPAPVASPAAAADPPVVVRPVVRRVADLTPATAPPPGAPAAGDEPQWEPDAAGFREVVSPFLTKHCVNCHGPDLNEGNFRVDEHLPNAFLDLSAKEKWGEVINVLNSHEMPPEDMPQPSAEEVARVVDWIVEQSARAELLRRDTAIVLRRLNRDEYQNTIRDLLGVGIDVSGFPQDPASGGFDNNGRALTLSPLLVELYLGAAREALDLALVEGERPPSLRWRFEPETGDGDSNRVEYDGQRVIVNGGQNPVEGPFKVLHHESWNKNLNARDFKLPHAGEYSIRVRAAGRVPDRAAVVASARQIHAGRLQERMKDNPKGEKYFREEMERDLKHFEADRMYDYGPPRLKLVKTLGGQPATVDEYDVEASPADPQVFETRTRMTTESAGVTVHYDYSVPSVLENFWMQGKDEFARPELLVDWIEIEGPLYESWPPESHTNLLPESPLREADEREYARDMLARFLRRAYRRPVADAEIDAKLALYDAVRPDAASFVQAIKTPLIATLVSPHFLYLAEPTEPADGRPAAPRTLDGHELASRLSYFLWSSMPDEALSDLADEGRLSDPAVTAEQVDRMLADPKSAAFVRNFAGQWLGLREVGANPPAEDLYPRYDRHLEVSIVRESEAFFEEILRHDLPATNLVSSDFVVINERLGRYYGIPGVEGDAFRRVTVPEGVRRGGVVTQASVLTITSNGTRTSPVKRGTWVLKNVLGTDPGLPVANAGDIAPKVPGVDKATVRQRLEIHRSLPQCARCHDKIDPLGFALENYDASGSWREKEGFGYKGRIGSSDPDIDASATLPDGTAFVGVEGLQNALMQQEDLFLKCLAGKLLTYALGRELGVSDRPAVDAAVAQMRAEGGTLRALIHHVAASEPFRTK
ncbi:DUF1592 domain-containing protein [Alienimonas californiensis]|uniref:Cytochrome c domain-containing protein n=1 Tax=Alienimonas californiensis TaxID=2527989 RepID=A0A517PA54_9PLAN|nr:DUF1592 domain-containing protein [Alienimonas californiensis]QDT16250.1 hypothetical protein CA12_23500 [Alienimonas californiensis]